MYSFNVDCGLSHCSYFSSCPVIEVDCLRLFLVLDYSILGGWLEIFILAAVGMGPQSSRTVCLLFAKCCFVNCGLHGFFGSCSVICLYLLIACSLSFFFFSAHEP